LVADAERHADRVFLRAGLNVDWVNCGGGPDASLDSRCAGTIPTGDLVVRIVPRARTLAEGIFGVSFVAGDTGTMQPHWQAEQLGRIAKGQMQFTPEQASRMRTKLIVRQKQNQPTPSLQAAIR
jgi:hypothetical protein